MLQLMHSQINAEIDLALQGQPVVPVHREIPSLPVGRQSLLDCSYLPLLGSSGMVEVL